MKDIRYNTILLLLAGCFLLLSCSNNEELTVYSTDNVQTDLGQKVVEGSNGYVGHLFTDSVYTVSDGIQALEMRILSDKGLAVRMFILEVDLNHREVTIKASAPNDENKLGVKQQMTLQALAHDRAGSRVKAAINGDFFNTTTGVLRGIYYRNGVCLKGTMDDSKASTFFGVTKEGTPVIGSYDDYDRYKDVLQEAVSGRARLLTNGNVLPQTDTSLQPRTAIGVTANNLVYMLVADGRNFWYSNGMNYTQMANVMQALGVQDAINLDGGGSSTFIIRNTANTGADGLEIRNWPSDNGGVEREVANGLLVVTNN